MQLLLRQRDLSKLMQLSLRQLCEQLHLESGQLVALDDGRVCCLEHFGPVPDRLMVASKLKRLPKAVIVADNQSENEASQLLSQHGLSLSVRLQSGEQVVGYLLLGSKLSGKMYDHHDLTLISDLASHLAVAIQDAKSYEELKAFNTSLLERANRATYKLRNSNRRLKELDKTKDEFLSMASHQLRTPLTTIKGYLSMVLEGDAGKVTPTQQEYLGYAFEGSKRMVALISDLLNVSRLSAGRFMIESLPCDISQVVADEVRQLQNHAEAKGLKLVYLPPAKPLPPVELDENKTRQVIMNFVDNAIYYTATGSVTVTLQARDGLIEMRVVDTGIGVPEAARHKLFSKFYRADNAQAMRPDGTGLGLYLAKRVIEDQGGTIIFETSEGHGSTFGFKLPIRVTNTKAKVTRAS